VKRRPSFFGRPSELPVVHARLALRTGAHLIALVPRLRDDGVYKVDCESVPLAPGSGDAATLATARAVLAVMERAIRANPEQWAMPHAVWLEAIAELAAIESAS
jgi:lauroyl/myristoyl acyltransferase